MARVVCCESGLGVLNAMTRLEVWGDPIDHSRSPALHGAAYRALGLDWEYGRRRVSEESFEREFVTARAELRGLSLTMPLKDCAYAAGPWRDARAIRTGVANTLLLTEAEPRAFNTDVGGLVLALAEHDVTEPRTARIIGSGATASSAVVAFAEAGVRDLEVVARSALKAAAIAEQAADLGIRATVRALDETGAMTPVDATIATLPGGTELAADVNSALAENGGALVDVVYAPWPSALALAWQSAGRPVASGLDMLLHQALLQVRIFVTGEVAEPLPNESVILAEMRSALMGD
ncbi:shikimate dehydrogenase family protein [Microbacterium gorillae]|uniref:shikimate dehydrogenase family protein n=1 Tax=Microbacterium gorillae TaxID=1231063 RepID=UPI000B160D15|nr:shikimate dehydrogenase [Microbacterium gorillae]